MKSGINLFSFIFFLIIGLNWQCTTNSEIDFGISPSDKHRGISWVGQSRPLNGWELDTIKYFGITHIAQSPYGWQMDPNHPDLRWEIHTDKVWWGESKVGLGETAEMARERNITSILKPHIWLRDKYPGEISMNSEGDWKLWFLMYDDFILYFARLAEEKQIPILCIGTELDNTTHRLKEWREIISNIRKVYSGKLIYAANFDHFEDVKFWDDLDYIGIQAYFPLSENVNPKVEEMVASWNKIHPRIEKAVRKHKKPVIFTEIGYCNTEDAAIEPWLWPGKRIDPVLSEEVQAKCYEAFFQSTWDKDWLLGAYFWKWYPQNRGFEPDFTPQGKKASEVLRSYFKRE